MEFVLSDEQQQKVADWMDSLPETESVGAIGGRYQFVFTPNSLGCSIVVLDLCSDRQLDVTDFDSW
jgi:hypothetical protein